MKRQKILAGVLTATMVLICAACGTATKETKKTTTTADSAATVTVGNGETTITGAPVTDAGGAIVTDAQGAVVTQAPAITTPKTDTAGKTVTVDGKTTTTTKKAGSAVKVTTTTKKATVSSATTTKMTGDLPFVNLRTEYGKKPVATAKNLSNSLYRLQHDKQLNVVYFGGSVTAGQCASDPERTSWRALTGTWLKTQYPKAQINITNAAIGGTATGYGVYRMERDIFSTCKKPDLVYVEFAINDLYQNYGADESYTYLESILKKLYIANPKVDIVLVLITDTMNMNRPWVNKTCHENIAKYYGLPVYDAGLAMYNAVQAGKGTWADYVAKNDIVHLSDNGYAFFASGLEDFLKKQFASSSATSYKGQVLPGEPYSKWNLVTNSEIMTGQEFKAKLAANDGWTAKNGTLLAYKKGTSCTYTFEGTGFSVWCDYQKRMSQATFYVDGVEVASPVCYDGGTDGSLHPTIVTNLPKGKHTVKIVNAQNFTFGIRYAFVTKN